MRSAWIEGGEGTEGGEGAEGGRLLLTVALSLAMAVGLGAQRVETPVPRVVQVTAERFAFTPSEISVAAGTEVEFRLRSEDTAHGFRILGHSVDVAIPKRGRGELTVRFVPPGPGKYTFECSRMCGAGHSFMRGTITVQPDGKGNGR